METAVTPRIGEVRIYRQMARVVHAVVKRCVDGLNEEESLIQPEPEGNCANWVMGHLLCTYDKILPALGQDPVGGDGAFKRYERYSCALKGSEGAMPMTEMMTAWDEAEKRIEEGLAGLTEERLNEPAPFSPSGNPKETMRTLLTTIFFHQSYHTGQLGLLRRMAGKPGALD
jgi:DinB superfamily